MKGDDVDLTILPLFLHHTHDGQAYINNGASTAGISSAAFSAGRLRWCSARPST
jgi:3-polyprenyl-4-hydroxybenzoate decarboxylase